MPNNETIVLLAIGLTVFKAVDYLLRRKENDKIIDKIEPMFKELTDKLAAQNIEAMETHFEMKTIKEIQNKMVENMAQITNSQMQIANSIINMERYRTEQRS